MGRMPIVWISEVGFLLGIAVDRMGSILGNKPAMVPWKFGHSACAASGAGDIKVFNVRRNYLSNLCDLRGQGHCGHPTMVERQSGGRDSGL